MWLLYQVSYALLAIVAAPWLLVVRGSHYLASLRPRLGNVPRAQEPRLWIHGVSVGEINVATTLEPYFSAVETPLAVTTVTPTGQERAQHEFAQAIVTFLPFEIGFAVRRFFDRIRPAALILCEGDLWPLVLRETKRRRIPALVVNGRISDRSFRRMQRLKSWLGPILEPIDAFAVQTAADASRLIALGVPADRITVTGNLKFETGTPREVPELAGAIADHAQGRPILVAGSTMRGEEEQVVEAFERLGGGKRALLILAPRHPERWSRVASRLRAAGLTLVRRSALEAPNQGTSSSEQVDLFLLDSLGELASVYGLASGAFIGGTLVATGGHNPLEAACHGVPIVTGPSMYNFKEIEEHFDREQAWSRAADAGELAEVWRDWLDHPEVAHNLGRRAKGVLENNKGAFQKTSDFLDIHLGEFVSRETPAK